MPIITKDQLGQTIEKGVKDGIPYGKITGQPPSPEEYAIQKMLEKREAIERAAQLETPTYGAWNPQTQKFISTNPNEIAELNASAEMKRTGLDRYYHPQSGAYFEAFHKIRDRYLQQELGKKAAIEAEGRAIVGNRLGAFDKILQNQKDIQKEKTESAGLEEWRKAQTKLLEAQAEGGGMTPAQNRQVETSKKRDVLKYVDDTIRAYGKIAAEAEKNGRPVPPQIIQGTAMAWDVKNKILSGKLNPEDVEYHDINNLPDMNNPATQIQPPKAEGVKITYFDDIDKKKTAEQRPISTQPTNDMDYILSESPTEQQIRNQQALQNITSAPKRILVDRPLEAHKMKKEAFEKDMAEWKKKGFSKEEIKKLALSKHREYLSSLR